MGEKEEKEKAEKLAAAKKRVAQLQKKKKAAGGGAGEKVASSSSQKSKDIAKAEKEDGEETPTSPTKPTPEIEAEVVEDAEGSPKETTVDETKAAGQDVDTDEAVFNDAIKAAQHPSMHEDTDEQDSVTPPDRSASPSADPPLVKSRHPARHPSISLQSKMRSASFRQGTTPTSPAVEEFPDIYRKQMARIEELEKENKRLAKEAEESRTRWQKNEEELEELREKAVEQNGDGSGSSEEVLKLRSEIESLRRNSRQSGSIPKSKLDADTENLRKELESKDSSISDMQLEISRLRSQVSALTSSGKDENEQIAALQDSLQRSETSHTKIQAELTDVKKALSRASEKAVLDGTERTSKETKIKALERELDQLKSVQTDSDTKRESLEKKIEAMNKLHRESEQRNAPKLTQADALGKEITLVKAKLEATEKEILKLREARKHRMSGEGAEDDLEELENEDRSKLEKRIRELEGENFDLRRGVWREKRKEMQPDLIVDAGDDAADGFDEVDLNGSGATTRKGSNMHSLPGQAQTKHSGFTQVFNSGLAAFRVSTTSPDSQLRTRPRNDSLLEEFDDDAFDEKAFATAQREEEMRKMVEHVREVKKGLKQWEGWRLDLVDLRRSYTGGAAGSGFGEIFEA